MQSVSAIVLCMLDVAAGGLLVASGRLRVLVKAMGVTLGATAAFFTLTLTQAGWNTLPSVWWGLVFFFCWRLTQSLLAIRRLYEV